MNHEQMSIDQTLKCLHDILINKNSNNSQGIEKLN